MSESILGALHGDSHAVTTSFSVTSPDSRVSSAAPASAPQASSTTAASASLSERRALPSEFQVRVPLVALTSESLVDFDEDV
jgi:hypothetical protein